MLGVNLHIQVFVYALQVAILTPVIGPWTHIALALYPFGLPSEPFEEVLFGDDLQQLLVVSAAHDEHFLLGVFVQEAADKSPDDCEYFGRVDDEHDA